MGGPWGSSGVLRGSRAVREVLWGSGAVRDVLGGIGGVQERLWRGPEGWSFGKIFSVFWKVNLSMVQ